MKTNKDYENLLQLLHTARARFLVVGAYAVITYTEPGYTKDLDIWISPDPQNAKKVFQALKKFGAPVRNLTIDDLTNPEMVYQIGIEPNRIDILMGVTGLEFEKAWKKRKTIRYGDTSVSILSLNDVIKSKKAVGRPQDMLDVSKLLNSKKRN